MKLWLSYIRSGAPSNAAPARTGIGRTKAEASAAAGHHANQAPYERFRRLEVYDSTPPPPREEAAVWDALSVCDGSYLPPTAEGSAILAEARAGRMAAALTRYYRALDLLIPLVRARPR
jgi:hypothetical protein